MFEFIPQVAAYLAMTGEPDDRDLMSGADLYGATYILETLVPQALAEGKKIVWVPDESPAGRSAIPALLNYRLESV